MSDTLIEFKNIKKVFDDTVVVEDFNLEVKKGEFVTLLGPSGCGKTTMLRILGGFELPTEGTIMLDGKDISMLPPNKRPINTVFQKYALFPHLNVYDNVAFGLKLKKISKKEQDEKVKKALELVDLEGFEKRTIHTLSGGQQQRIAIARAIVNEPEVLLLDESLSALDYKMRKEMQVELKNMHKKLGITFIFVTHDQEEALTMSDKIVVMADGEIQQIGTPEEIYNEPKNLFVADFIGESNIFKGTMTEYHKARFCGTEFDCVDDYEKDMVIDAVIRPEDIVITDASKGQITGEVLSCDFKGTFYIVVVQAGKNEIEIHSLKNYQIGETVGMCIEPDNIHIIPYDSSINHYVGEITKSQEEGLLHVEFVDFEIDVEPSRIIPGATMGDGEVVGPDGEIIDTLGLYVEASFAPADADLTDDAEQGLVVGNIFSFIYVDDHYRYTVRSKSEEDYVVNDEDLWNQEDYVGVIIPEDKISFRIIEDKADEE
ncbi:MAG: ABC transporter ATP-binding protein [Lachnospiraceae bacterium]|nr:ABC transporter ATP-binding protein [Lachnospiraceae bacterium]